MMMRTCSILISGMLALLCSAMPAVAQVPVSESKAGATSAVLSMEAREARYLNQPYPEFRFQLNSGKTLSSAELRGKVVVIDCWFEACPPCMAEIDALNELQDSLAKNPDVVFFSIAREGAANLDRIVAERGIRYTAVAQPDSASRYNFSGGYPTKIVVDRQGLVAYYSMGGNPDKVKARAQIIGGFLPKVLAIAKK